MLNSERNTPAMMERVEKAAARLLHTVRGNVQAHFEHGQWWITDMRTFAVYSVVDAEGGPAVDGFDLEQVSAGEEV